MRVLKTNTLIPARFLLRDNYRRRFLLGHELYIRLCLLDDIFTYEILDIGTVADMYVFCVEIIDFSTY